MGDAALTDQSVVVRARRSALWQGVLIACALAIPMLATLYWLAIPAGRGWWVFGVMVAAVLAIVVVALRYTAMSVKVTDADLVVEPFLPGTRSIPLREVARAIVLRLRRNGATEPVTQMFVLDRDGSLLLRMRGEHWSDEAINNVASRLVTAPIEHLQSTVSLDELQRSNPDMLDWFERRPQRSR